MKQIAAAFLLALFVLAAAGCSFVPSKSDSGWAISPTFKVTVNPPGAPAVVYQMRGFEDHFGFIDVPFTAGQAQKVMWAFWGNADNLLYQQLIVQGVHQETGKRIGVVDTKVEGSTLGGTGGTVTSMTLPDPGRWRLEVTVGDKHLGDIVVDAGK